MTWSDFYLFCFLVGFSLSVISFLAGAVHIHLPVKWHLPLHLGHHGGGIAKGGLHKGGSSGVQISWFNASTIMAFLAWFGGAGYLLTRYAHFLVVVILAIAAIAGLFAGWVIFKFMVKLNDAPLTSEDRRVEGALGTISMPIREKGTGEIIFPVDGVRRCAGARSSDGMAIAKGTEVVIERYEKGIAYVKRWEEFSK
jgi:membrane protein implicated in regulation of membrane protease activity